MHYSRLKPPVFKGATFHKHSLSSTLYLHHHSAKTHHPHPQTYSTCISPINTVAHRPVSASLHILLEAATTTTNTTITTLKMQFTLATLALAALAAAKPMPGGVTSAISPSASAPAGCKASYPGSFSIQTVNVSSSAKVKVRTTYDIVSLIEQSLTLCAETS